MRGHVKQRLDIQLEMAEHGGRCLLPGDRRDRRALYRVAKYTGDTTPRAYLREHSAPPSIVSPFLGLYMRGEYWATLDGGELAVHILRTFALAHSEWMFCSFSAALLYNLEVPWELAGTIHIAQEKSGRSRSTKEIKRHVTPFACATRVQGVLVTGVAETVLECLCETSFELGLAIVDSALHQKRATKESLEEYFAIAGKGRKNIAHARAVLSYADGRAENGGESRARAVMIEEGFAPHALQVPFSDPFDAGHSMRGDMGWEHPDGYWIIGELDGKGKYIDPDMMNGGDVLDVLLAERQRESRMTAYGTHIMRFPFDYVLHREKLVQLMQLFGVPHSEIPIIPGRIEG